MPDGREAVAGGGAAPDPFARVDPPELALTLWPNRSLGRKGWTVVLALLAAGLALPLVPLLGTKVAWGMLPFLVGVLVAVYLAVRRSHFDGRLTEELRLWPDRIAVERREPDGTVRRWDANPFWVRVRLIEGAHVEKYLTLEGGGREIELGAFLSPGEREELHDRLVAALAQLRTPHAG
jgi:uncharacterized membrane protein